ncbi:hypothetical protein [Sphingomonas sp. M1-B02]|uniref:hypothetical protein n=1 Tax=Sphingomonas sp. M1-B02 TaxID=3114300 RepID=UPI00223FE9EF|nr:hypothetical protein [Sphingomonas sp. S6-11]UZK65816.1 hypothetical protein OKW87_15085 [Sphingomonas sp. S6-11]
MTTHDLQDLFLATLLRRIGGNRRRWKTVIGPVRVYDLATHAHCNWSITPNGASAEIACVERIADELRLSHPIVSG